GTAGEHRGHGSWGSSTTTSTPARRTPPPITTRPYLDGTEDGSQSDNGSGGNRRRSRRGRRDGYSPWPVAQAPAAQESPGLAGELAVRSRRPRFPSYPP